FPTTRKAAMAVSPRLRDALTIRSVSSWRRVDGPRREPGSTAQVTARWLTAQSDRGRPAPFPQERRPSLPTRPSSRRTPPPSIAPEHAAPARVHTRSFRNRSWQPQAEPCPVLQPRIGQQVQGQEGADRSRDPPV